VILYTLCIIRPKVLGKDDAKGVADAWEAVESRSRGFVDMTS
jgi:hypothetical protein